jgi:hypothetical protein
MLSGVIGTRKSARIYKTKLLTGKRKDKAADHNTATASDDEETFSDSQQNMEMEDNDAARALTLYGNTGEGDQTNSHLHTATTNMQLK